MRGRDARGGVGPEGARRDGDGAGQRADESWRRGKKRPRGGSRGCC